jgi:hypothetical protein
MVILDLEIKEFIQIINKNVRISFRTFFLFSNVKMDNGSYNINKL